MAQGRKVHTKDHEWVCSIKRANPLLSNRDIQAITGLCHGTVGHILRLYKLSTHRHRDQDKERKKACMTTLVNVEAKTID